MKVVAGSPLGPKVPRWPRAPLGPSDSLPTVSDEAPAAAGEEAALFEAVLSIAADLDLEGALRRIVAAACELTGARFGALGVLDPSGEELSQFITHGLSDDEEAEIGPRPAGHGVLGLLITDPRPIRLADLAQHERSFGFPDNHPPMHSFLGVPIRVRGLVFGNLYLTEKRFASQFSARDEHLLSSLAAAAGVAIDNARLHQRLGELAVFADRDRIARDLHDTVIQRLFAVGLSLQGLARVVDPPSAAERIDAAVDELDATIADIRSTIFALQARNDPGIRSDVTTVVTELRDLLGHLPRLQFDGPIDTSVDKQVGESAAAVVREALSNVARHARATRTDVALTAGVGEFVVVVRDDGIGIRRSASRGGQGLRNMATRAEQLGGRLDVTSEPGEGTTVTWRIPV
jgi:signal transduction histidine kinase